VLSRYEILREVSRGRHAMVLQAIDREEDLTVALKVYDVDDAESVARLRSEARVLLNLVPHPALRIVRHSFVDGFLIERRRVELSKYVLGGEPFASNFANHALTILGSTQARSRRATRDHERRRRIRAKKDPRAFARGTLKEIDGLFMMMLFLLWTTPHVILHL
jgi:hypothetical protein